MQYTVKHNGVNCTLPAFTRAIKGGVDEVNSKISDSGIPLDDRIEAMYVFLNNVIEKDALTKALGGENLEDIDLNDMNLLYLKITKEYDRPVTEFEKPELDADMKKMLQEINSVANSVSTIQRAVKK